MGPPTNFEVRQLFVGLRKLIENPLLRCWGKVVIAMPISKRPGSALGDLLLGSSERKQEIRARPGGTFPEFAR